MSISSWIGNASILVLHQIAGALHCPLAELTGDLTTSSPEWLSLRELLFNERGGFVVTWTSDSNGNMSTGQDGDGSGVFGQLCVMEGSVTYHGFADEQAEEPELSLVIRAGEFATSPPQYWHRVELSEDARFNIHFWAEQGSSDQPLFNSRK